MRKLIIFFLLIFVLYVSWPVFANQLNNEGEPTFVDNLFQDQPEILNVLTSIIDEVNQFVLKIEDTVNDSPAQQEEARQKQVEKPDLAPPSQQTFSVHNIEIGDLREDVELAIGAPKRSTMNEYGTEWHTYHEDYQNFMMVAYDEQNKVAGLYTNQDLISSKTAIQSGTAKEAVREQLGEPLTQIRKGLTFYQIAGDQDHQLYQIDDSFITIFYDKHTENTVTAILIIDKKLEQQKSNYYAAPSEALKEGFEYQLFDLTNADRVNHGVPILTWDDPVRETARDHSEDMAEQNYFDHTNLEGQSPFDRMLEDQIAFSVAGENLASGQLSSIFAHEGLMNSLGHRENILRPEFALLGVGVAFNTEAQPYFTENFYTK